MCVDSVVLDWGGGAFCLAGYICREAFLVFMALGEGIVSEV